MNRLTDDKAATALAAVYQKKTRQNPCQRRNFRQEISNGSFPNNYTYHFAKNHILYFNINTSKRVKS